MYFEGLARPGSRMPRARLDDHSRPPAFRGGDPKKGVDEALGRSGGGFSTKLHLAVDDEGRPLELTVTPGQEHDICQAPRLLADHEPPYVIADKGYDSDELVRHVEKRGSTAVIPSRSGRITPRRQLKRKYRHRNHVERFVSRITHFRRVATQYENTARNFLGLIKLAALLSWPECQHDLVLAGLPTAFRRRHPTSATESMSILCVGVSKLDFFASANPFTVCCRGQCSEIPDDPPSFWALFAFRSVA